MVMILMNRLQTPHEAFWMDISYWIERSHIRIIIRRLTYYSIVTDEHKKASGRLNNVLATYREAEDLVNIGAYKPGSNKNIDYALEKIDAVNDYLMQGVNEKFTFEDEVKMLCDIFEEE